MPTLPAVSVVIPCYNAARYVAGTLRSVLEQAGVELDVIVVDDGSRDGSADRVEREFPQVRLIRQANQGVAVARNRGIEAARHEWVAFVDADDLWLPGKLAAQFDLLGRHPTALMAYTAWWVWPSEADAPDEALLQRLAVEADSPERWASPTGWIYPELLNDCHVWTSTVVARRSLLQELDGFDPALRIGEDYDLWLKASRITPIVKVPRPLALYRHHTANVTRGVPKANHKGEIIGRAIQRWGYASPDGRRARRVDVARGLARSWGDFAGAQLGVGHYAAARHAALTSLRAHPAQLLGWTVLAKTVAASLAQVFQRR